MAKEIINQTQPSTNSIPMENLDKASAKLAILHANLQLIHGEGAENFQTFSDKLKDTYLWGCATLAGEALELINQPNNH